MAALAARRIPKFADKLRAALAAADLPEGVDPYVDAPVISPDPTVIFQFEYKPGCYDKAFFRTDARNRDHLDPVLIVRGCLVDAEKGTRDPRFTDRARAASRQHADVLAAWLAERGAMSA